MRETKRRYKVPLVRIGDSVVVHRAGCMFVLASLNDPDIPTTHVRPVSVRDIVDLGLRSCRQCRPSAPALSVVPDA